LLSWNVSPVILRIYFIRPVEAVRQKEKVPGINRRLAKQTAVLDLGVRGNSCPKELHHLES
ncbi:MAG: hypothetical protein KDA70_21080, partial [Planctomycetaceae bacterium]|nr:hypothetical protein [Planctomycetaceae bacterium]